MTAAMPYAHLGEALATDYLLVREQFSDEQWEHFIATRRFVDTEVLPAINDYWERAEPPWPLIKRLAELGVVGEDIDGYGCPGMTPLAAGLVNMELHRGDGSLGTFLGVQSGLAMKSIAMLGSDEQKERWLPPMARLETIGAFALTEPEHGSDSVALDTRARRDGGDYVIDGAKRWIGNATIADVVVVWARSDDDGHVKGFLVATDTPGYEASVIDGKGATRAIWQADVRFDGVRVRREPAPGGEQLQGRRSGPDRHAKHHRVGRARTRGGRLRHGAELHEAAHPVRTTAVQLPDRAGPPREDAGRGHGHAALLHAALTPGGCGPPHGHDRGAGEDEQHPQGATGDRRRARPAGRQRDPAREPCHPPSDRHRGPAHLRRAETIQTLIVGRDITGVAAFT